MRIAVVSDAWHPQINGVIRVLESLIVELSRQGHGVDLITPADFRTMPCPTYPEIRLSLFPAAKVAAMLERSRPDAVHIATEGPLGWAAQQHCRCRGWRFTTAYHSKFPEYVAMRTGLPLSWLYAAARRFHARAERVLVPSPSVFRELTERGFDNAVAWNHGVDMAAFRPRGRGFLDLPRPIHMYVGRVAVEKNLPAFLELDLPGSKVVVGGGPARAGLMRRFADARFFIARGDDELSRYFSAADVFVFPSRTDTFGLVMLEALACGVPVAAFPVAGPLDVIGRSGAGVLDEDLSAAIARARLIPAELCRAHAAKFSWTAVAEQFLNELAPIRHDTEAGDRKARRISWRR